MTDLELRAIAKSCGWDITLDIMHGDPKNKDFIEADLSKIIQALKKVRDETIEECAKVADNIFIERDGEQEYAVRRMAIAIRNLKHGGGR